VRVFSTRKSKHWVARYRVAGKNIDRSLGVKVLGDRAPAFTPFGEQDFEEAVRKSEVLEKGLRLSEDRLDPLIDSQDGRVKELLEEIRYLRFGDRVKPEEIRLSELADLFARKDRRKKGSDRYLAQCIRKITSFVSFVEQSNPKTFWARGVPRGLAIRWLDNKWAEGVTGKTYNDYLSVLRTLWKELKHSEYVDRNIWEGIELKEVHTIHRTPFTKEEIEKIETVKGHRIAKILFSVGVRTGLRKADIFKLRWEHVDLEQEVIQTIASKNGKPVFIPIMERLLPVLIEAGPRKKGFVWPELERLYTHSPDTLTLLFKDMVVEVLDDSNGECSKREARNFTRIEHNGQQRKRRASKYDIHALKTTFITLALEEEKMLVEDIKEICGNQSVEIILKHYDQRDPKKRAQKLRKHMPNI